jgi:TRAP-type C4-dicarboxylate transport system permease small subunit
MVWFLLAVPIGFALMLLRLTQSLLRDMRSFRDGTPVYEGAKLFD